VPSVSIRLFYKRIKKTRANNTYALWRESGNITVVHLITTVCSWFMHLSATAQSRKMYMPFMNRSNVIVVALLFAFYLSNHMRSKSVSYKRNCLKNKPPLQTLVVKGITILVGATGFEPVTLCL
jgi:cation transport ATPase